MCRRATTGSSPGQRRSPASPGRSIRESPPSRSGSTTARLAAVPDIDCWRQWVWDWNATPGSHLIQARATDAAGYTQTALQQPPEPNGATGYPGVSVSVARA